MAVMSMEIIETMSDLMWCRCRQCGSVFEARFRSTVCPHESLFEQQKKKEGKMIVVRYIDVASWKRWRHERLRRIWKAMGTLNEHEGQLHILPYINKGRESHAQCLNNIYEGARTNESVDILIVTEEDFLPSSSDVDWIWRMEDDLLESGAQILAPVRQRANKGDTAPFVMAFNLNLLRRKKLEFDHPRDPAADLHEQAEVQHFSGKLEPQHHDGWNYKYGTHLLYQRHLHDPVDMRCGNVILGEMQKRHDLWVEAWIREQPHDFRRIYESFEVSQ